MPAERVTSLVTDEGIDDVSFNRLTAGDVVRHRLVGKIVAAYDEFEADRQARIVPDGPAGREGRR